MLAGSMFGGLQTPAADPRNYDEQGQPIKPSRKTGWSPMKEERHVIWSNYAWTMRIGGTIWRQNTRIYPKMSAFL